MVYKKKIKKKRYEQNAKIEKQKKKKDISRNRDIKKEKNVTRLTVTCNK